MNTRIQSLTSLVISAIALIPFMLSSAEARTSAARSRNDGRGRRASGFAAMAQAVRHWELPFLSISPETRFSPKASCFYEGAESQKGFGRGVRGVGFFVRLPH